MAVSLVGGCGSGGNWLVLFGATLAQGRDGCLLFFPPAKPSSLIQIVMILNTSDGETIHNPPRVMEKIKTFYHSLYSFKNPPEDLDDTNCDPFFPKDNYVLLSPEQKNSCEGLITEKELWEAISSFKDGKSPGLDGIPIEVYKTFFSNLKHPLLQCFNYAYEKGNLSKSQREGLITLLLKQDADGQYKDPTLLNNWRPLSLLCCDVRILSKVISLRMRNVIASLINKDQSGFLQNRFIGENICQILEIIQISTAVLIH